MRFGPQGRGRDSTRCNRSRGGWNPPRPKQVSFQAEPKLFLLYVAGSGWNFAQPGYPNHQPGIRIVFPAASCPNQGGGLLSWLGVGADARIPVKEGQTFEELLIEFVSEEEQEESDEEEIDSEEERAIEAEHAACDWRVLAMLAHRAFTTRLRLVASKGARRALQSSWHSYYPSHCKSHHCTP